METLVQIESQQNVEQSIYLNMFFDKQKSKVGICNLSPQLRNIADNQIDCGVADK